MRVIVYYTPIAIDPADPWVLLFPCIDIALAGDDNYLLSSIRIDPADQWGIIISLHYCRIGWCALLFIIPPLQLIQPTLGFYYCHASASDDNYLLSSMRIDSAKRWGMIISLHYCGIGRHVLIIYYYCCAALLYITSGSGGGWHHFWSSLEVDLTHSK